MDKQDTLEKKDANKETNKSASEQQNPENDAYLNNMDDFKTPQNLADSEKTAENAANSEPKSQPAKVSPTQASSATVATAIHIKHENKAEPDEEFDISNAFKLNTLKDKFSRLKHSFKKEKSSHLHSHHHESYYEPSSHKHSVSKPEVHVSFMDFLRKYKTILLILIPIILCIYLRVQTAYLPITDQWATSTVDNYYKSQLGQEIDAQYPNLPDANKNLLLDQELQKYYAQNKDMVEQQKKATSENLRSQFQDNSGHTYLLEIDPYFWYRYARNYVDHGYDLDIELNGRYFNNHRLAPLLDEDIKAGVGSSKFKIQQMIVALEIYIYKIVSVIAPGVTLMQVAFFLPVILTTLAVIPMFFFARRLAGDFGGLIASILLVINPFVLYRTIAGFSDTDPFNLLFPILIFLLVTLALEHRKLITKFTFAVLAGISVGLYAYSWSGWTFVFSFSLILIVGIICYKLVKMFFARAFDKKEVVGKLGVLVLFVLSSGIFAAIFGHGRQFVNTIYDLVYFLNLKAVATNGIWPNVFTTVAELNPGDVNHVIATAGGKLFMFFAIAGILLSFYYKEEIHAKDGWFLGLGLLWSGLVIGMSSKFSTITMFAVFLSVPVIMRIAMIILEWFSCYSYRQQVKDYNIIYIVLLSLYLFGTMFSISRGVRFSVLFVPAFSLCMGIGIGIAIKKLTELGSRTLNINKIVTATILIIFVGVLFITPVQAAVSSAKQMVPNINDQWIDALNTINLKSDKTAIINSWWDFGHWFECIGDRGTTLNGGGQDQPQAHWLGKLMLAKDEDESVGILRMLDCGKTYPHEKLTELFKDELKAKNTLDSIIKVDKEKARKILEDNNLSEDDITYILSKTHCDPPDDYFITSEDMVSKAAVWGHFGAWDFEKASMYNQVKGTLQNTGVNLLVSEFNLSEETAKKYYAEIQTTDADQWISPWPGFVSGRPMNCKKISDTKFECPVPLQQGLILEVNLDNQDAFIQGNDQKYYLEEVYMPVKEGFEVYTPHGATLSSLIHKELSATIIPSSYGNYQILVSEPMHAGTTFTKLFFAEGNGMTHFKKIFDTRDVTGARIIVWKVDWEGKEANKPYAEFFGEKLPEALPETPETETVSGQGTEAEPAELSAT